MKDDRMDKVLEKLREALDGEASPEPLTASEVAQLRAMMDAYQMLLASGRVGRLFVWSVLSLAALITALVTLAGHFGITLRVGGGQ